MRQNICRRLRKLLKIISTYFSNCWLWTIGKIKMLFAWFKAILRWLIIEPIFIWVILILIVVPVSWLWFQPSESHARYVGFFLQFLGICTVAWEVNKTFQHFNKPGFLGRFINWFDRFPKLGTKVYVASGNITAHAKMHGHIRVFNNDDPTASTEDRLDAIAKNQIRLQKEIEEISTSIHQELEKHKIELDAEKKERKAKDQDILNKLEQAHIEELHISIAGVFLLIIGVALATLPEEITELITNLK